MDMGKKQDKTRTGAEDAITAIENYQGGNLGVSTTLANGVLAGGSAKAFKNELGNAVMVKTGGRSKRRKMSKKNKMKKNKKSKKNMKMKKVKRGKKSSKNKSR